MVLDDKIFIENISWPINKNIIFKQWDSVMAWQTLKTLAYGVFEEEEKIISINTGKLEEATLISLK